IAYKAYNLPFRSYCSSVWSPYSIGDIEALESVQHLFTRVLPGYNTLPYAESLNKLNLPTLELRRLRRDLVLCYKILYGFISGIPEDYGLKLVNRDMEHLTRGHDLKLSLTYCKVD